MNRKILWTAALACAATLTLERAVMAAMAKKTVKLDNKRVTVSEMVYDAEVPRDPYTRPTDQVIIFLDDCQYERKDASGKTELRTRKSGDVIWHDKGELAPQLTNKGSKAYRTIQVEVK